MAWVIRRSLEVGTGNLVDDPASRDHDDPVAETRELERIARLDDDRHALSRLFAKRLVDVEAEADVDALGRLVSEDRMHRASQERASERDLLLVSARQRQHGLLDRRRTDLQPSHEIENGRSLTLAAEHADPAVTPQHLNRRVRSYAQNGKQRLPDSIAAQEAATPARRGPMGDLVTISLPLHRTVPVERSTPATDRRNCTWPLPSAPAMPRISPLCT